MKLTSKVAKWGNSLALHLTKEMLEASGFREGDRVSITYENGSIVIRKVLP